MLMTHQIEYNLLTPVIISIAETSFADIVIFFPFTNLENVSIGSTCFCTWTLSVQTKKVHRFTNNLQGLQKVMVKDFS